MVLPMTTGHYPDTACLPQISSLRFVCVLAMMEGRTWSRAGWGCYCQAKYEVDGHPVCGIHKDRLKRQGSSRFGKNCFSLWVMRRWRDTRNVIGGAGSVAFRTVDSHGLDDTTRVTHFGSRGVGHADGIVRGG
jgi:hypothetical protein